MCSVPASLVDPRAGTCLHCNGCFMQLQLAKTGMRQDAIAWMVLQVVEALARALGSMDLQGHEKALHQGVSAWMVLQVVGALARALGQPWKEYAERLLEPMALTGLSQELVDAFCSVRA